VKVSETVMETLVRRSLKWGRDYRWTCGQAWWDDLDSAALYGLAVALDRYKPGQRGKDGRPAKTLLGWVYTGVHLSVRSFLRTHQGWYVGRKEQGPTVERRKAGYTYLEDVSVAGSSWEDLVGTTDPPDEATLHVRDVLPQGLRLSPRDLLVIELACQGRPDPEIGDLMGISAQRVQQVRHRVREAMVREKMVVGGEPVPVVSGERRKKRQKTVQERLRAELGR